MNNTKFYLCSHCGNIVEMVHDAGVKPFCCGQEMEELIPNTVDASGEKHIPVVKVCEGIVEVNVGSVDHPMVDVHWIEWIQLVTDKGSYRKWLNPSEAPNVKFLLGEEKPVAVYAYCNLHGLWKTELN
ncbi:MAG: desulfoferrodoxin [Oscillospiraceae bacterium]|nr:desulfoferrodoxin [Oscillospiraceae bacterium]